MQKSRNSKTRKINIFRNTWISENMKFVKLFASSYSTVIDLNYQFID